MRKVQLLFVCLMLSAAAFAADKVVKLPKPNLNRTGTVMKALSERQSTREYASKALTLADLSDLLWAANGINRSDAGKRTAPSAMNKQDVDVYVILSEGSYLYDAKNHHRNLTIFQFQYFLQLSGIHRSTWHCSQFSRRTENRNILRNNTGIHGSH